MDDLKTSLGLTIDLSRVPTLHIFIFIGFSFTFKFITAHTSLSYVLNSLAIRLATASGELKTSSLYKEGAQ